MLYPLLFTPIHKEKIWGGNRLSTVFNRALVSEKIGESWEISSHGYDTSIISNGFLRGVSLEEAINKYGDKLLGKAIYNEKNRKFPLLIKLIDASDILSVQVHPDDEYADKNEDGERGKTEAWYIIEAEPGAKLIYGLKKYISKANFIQSLKDGILDDCLNELEVTKGDVLCIPAGLVHAIGKGILLCEVQQNSDTTYRVYDFNRTDSEGNSRELHIEKALDVIDFKGKRSCNKLPGLKMLIEGGQRIIYIACEYFALEKLIVNGRMKITLDGKRFQTLTCIEGKGKIEYEDGSIALNNGTSSLVPANIKKFFIEGNCTIIRSYVPDKEENISKPLFKEGYSIKDLEMIAGLFD